MLGTRLDRIITRSGTAFPLPLFAMAAIGCLLFAVAAIGCHGEPEAGFDPEQNLANARTTYDRLEPGMSHEDACWYIGMSCDVEDESHSYAKDFGRSFSGKEYKLRMRIEGGVLISVSILKPRYEGKTRKDGGELIVEKSLEKP